MRFSIAICFILCIVSPTVQAQWPDWERLPGPTGGPIESFAAVGEDIVAAAAGGAFYRSADGGRTWQDVFESEWTRNTALLHGTADDMLFALGYGGVHRSSDHGGSWVECGIGEFAQYAASASDGTVLLGLRGSIAVSTDEGESWTRTYPDPGSNRDFKVAIDAAGNWYAGGNQVGPFRSSDKGQTWESIAAGLLNVAVYSVSVVDGNLLFIGVNNATFRSTDRGDTWEAVAGLDVTNVYSVQMTQLPSGPALIADTYTGPRISTDGGMSWERGIFQGYSDVSSVFTRSDGIVLVSAAGRVLRSDDGSALTVSDTGLLLQSITAIGTMEDEIVLVGSGYVGLYRSTDSGETWQYATPGFPWYAVQEIHTLNRDRADVLTSEGEILCTSDGGATWAKRIDSLGGGPFLSLVGAGEFLAVSSDGRIFYFSDRVNGWEQRGSIQPSSGSIGAAKLCFNFNGTNPVHLAATDLGLYRSTDWGSTWNPVLVDGLAKWFTEMANWGSTVFAATANALYESSDAGATWTAGSIELRAPRFLTFNDDGDFYLMDEDSLRFLPRPAIGGGWRTFSAPPFTDVNCLRFIPHGDAHAGRLLAGTQSHGVLRSVHSTLSAPTAERTPEAFAIDGMYPVPLTGASGVAQLHLILELPRSGSVTVEVCDMLGRVLQRFGPGSLQAGHRELAIPINTALPSAMMLLRVHGPGGMRQRLLPLIDAVR